MTDSNEPKPWAAYAVIGVLVTLGVIAVVIGSRDPAPAAPKPEPTPAPTASEAPPVDDGQLQIQDIKVGTGDTAVKGDTVTVQYAGSLMNGTEFDNSRKHGTKGFTFPLGDGRVIKGWDQGVVGMKIGGTRKLTIPPSLGYGHRGAGAQIPPDSALVFVIDLESINKP